MGFENLENNSFTTRLLVKLAQMLARDYQNRASEMTADELYEASDFLPTYNEDRDYSGKPAGYVCKSIDGVIMRLAEPSATFDLNDSKNGASQPMWGYIWSKDPKYAKTYVRSELTPYNAGDCCLWNDEVYISKIDENYHSPEEAPNDWKKNSQGENLG